MADTKRTVTVAQIGCGYWGPNLLRNLHGAAGCRVIRVAETSSERRDYVAHHYPGVALTADAAEAIHDADVDAIVIATDAGTHAALARAALEAGKHLLVEKPLALTVADADALVALAAGKERVLLVGHTYLYNDALAVIAREIGNGALGDLFYFDMNRLNLGIARTDVNVWWNLAPHDVSVLLHLMGDRLPTDVSASGAGFIQDGIEDTVVARLRWDGDVVAHIHVSWLSPDKVRRMTVVGSRRMLVLDELAEHPVTVYDKGIDLMPAETARRDYDDFTGTQLVHRIGDARHPAVGTTEPLTAEIADFVAAIAGGRAPVSHGGRGRDVVAVLAAGQQSLDTGGAPVPPAPAPGGEQP